MNNNNKIIIDEIKGEYHAIAKYYPDYLSKTDSDALFEQLMNYKDKMTRDVYKIMGKRRIAPRLSIAFGEGVYSYSGMNREAFKWPYLLLQLKERLQKELNQVFNYALVNLYEDGKQYIGWHSDKERDLVSDAWIASISLGAERDFQVRYRKDIQKNAPIKTISLKHGSLFLMNMEMQRVYAHCLPIRKRVTNPRINITFRCLKK